MRLRGKKAKLRVTFECQFPCRSVATLATGAGEARLAMNGRLDAIYPPLLRALNRHIVCLHVRPLLTHCKGNYILYSPLVRRQMMFPLSIIALACQIVIIKQVNNKFHF